MMFKNIPILLSHLQRKKNNDNSIELVLVLVMSPRECRIDMHCCESSSTLTHITIINAVQRSKHSHQRTTYTHYLIVSQSATLFLDSVLAPATVHSRVTILHPK